MRVNPKQFETNKDLASHDLLDEVRDPHAKIRWFVCSLSKLDRKIIRHRFGFYRRLPSLGLTPYHFIADKMKLSESYIRKRCSLAISKFRRMVKMFL